MTTEPQAQTSERERVIRDTFVAHGVPGLTSLLRQYMERIDKELLQIRDLQAKLAAREAPIPMVLHCPECFLPHLDVGEWAARPHRTHRCANCGTKWRPANVPTVGVESLAAAHAPRSEAGEGKK